MLQWQTKGASTFFFCLSSPTLIRSAKQPMWVILHTDRPCWQYDMLSLPKSRRQGPTRANSNNNNIEIKDTDAHRWPKNGWLSAWCVRALQDMKRSSCIWDGMNLFRWFWMPSCEETCRIKRAAYGYVLQQKNKTKEFASELVLCGLYEVYTLIIPHLRLN